MIRNINDTETVILKSQLSNRIKDESGHYLFYFKISFFDMKCQIGTNVHFVATMYSMPYIAPVFKAENERHPCCTGEKAKSRSHGKPY